jgi:hypothetical protein
MLISKIKKNKRLKKHVQIALNNNKVILLEKKKWVKGLNLVQSISK